MAVIKERVVMADILIEDGRLLRFTNVSTIETEVVIIRDGIVVAFEMVSTVDLMEAVDHVSGRN